MKNLNGLLQEIIRLTFEIESKYPELYHFLDENPSTLPESHGEVIDRKSLKNYLESLKLLLSHHVQSHGVHRNE